MTSAPHPDAACLGRVGPNAVLQLIAALRAAGLEGRLAALFTACGVADWLSAPPAAMVDEHDVARLHQGLRAGFAPALAERLLDQAGHRTAAYLLSARIPPLAQRVLKALPPSLAARLLVTAIRRNAWTFAGSGRFTARVGRTVRLEIEGNPFCAGEYAAAPVCHWHRAVFAHLFRTLVSPRAQVVETGCEAAGGRCCAFEVSW